MCPGIDVSLVVIIDVIVYFFKKIHALDKGVQVNVPMFNGFPEPLDPGVIGCLSFTIHGGTDLLRYSEGCRINCLP